MATWRRRQPITPVVRKTSPAPAPAAAPPPPEPGIPDVDYDERADILGNTPDAAFRRALRAGFSEQSAAIWAAYACGIPLADMRGPWTLKQVREIVFYQAAHRNGRLRG